MREVEGVGLVSVERVTKEYALGRTRVPALRGVSLEVEQGEFLAVAGPEDVPDLWIWNVDTGELRVRMSHSPDDSLSCVAWHKDGQRLVCGGTKGQFYLCVSAEREEELFLT